MLSPIKRIETNKIEGVMLDFFYTTIIKSITNPTNN